MKTLPSPLDMARFLALRPLIAFALFGLYLLSLVLSDLIRILPGLALAAFVLNAAITPGSAYRNLTQRIWWWLPLIFLLHLAHWPLTDPGNEGAFQALVVLKLPFLLLPLAVALLPPLPFERLRALLFGFIAIMTLLSLGALVNYALNFKEINALYVHSKIMPLPMNHVRFSLLVGFATVVLYWLTLRGHLPFPKWKRSLSWALLIFLVAYLHILSVRSGLLCLYAFAGLEGIRLALEPKFRKWGLIGLAAMVALPLLGYLAVPTFHRKVNNTLRDLSKVDNPAEANRFSMVGRVVSYQIAWGLVERQPVLGTGIGNLWADTKAEYERRYPVIIPQQQKYAHNQYLHYLAGFGIIGLAVFLVGFYAPLFSKRTHGPGRHLLQVHYLMLTLSFLVEMTLDTQLGQTYALGFLCLFLWAGVTKPQPGSGAETA